MRWLVLVLALVAGCGGAGQHRLAQADAGVTVLRATWETAYDLAEQFNPCTRQTPCVGGSKAEQRWSRIARGINSADHWLSAAEAGIQVGQDPANLAGTLTCGMAALSDALAGFAAAGVDLPPALAGWMQQSGIPGAMCNWEPDPNAHVATGAAGGA